MASGAALALVTAACVAVQVVSPSPASATVTTFVPVIAAGASHSCQIQSGHASCWGDNSNGELGNNSTINSNVPVPVYTGGVLNGKTLTQITAGTNFTCVLDSAGVAYCWGLGTSGQLGDSFSVTSNVPVRVSGALTLTQITSGAAFTCGVTSAGAAYCWGLGGNGQLGNGAGATSNAPVPVSGGFNLAQIAAGGATACALSSTNVAYCWGAGGSGQLGNGLATTSQPTPTPVTPPGVTLTQISVGTNFACAVSSAGKAYCWGSNANDQLGTTTTPNNVPVAVTVGGASQITSGTVLTQISAGDSTTCALVGGSNVAYCWGAGASGQLGNGFTTALQATAVAVTPTGVLSGVTLTQVSAGTSFACAVASQGVPDCWGANGSGQLGNPATAAAATFFDVPVPVTSSPANIAPGYLHACMLRGGKAYCWGDDANGDMGIGGTAGPFGTPQQVLASAGVPFGVTLAQIASSNSFSCALTTAGAAYCWGAGGSGQMGNGSLTGTSYPGPVTMGGNTFSQISTGVNFVCALTTAGNAYCWGANSNGQMGTTLATSPQKTPIAVTMPGSTVFTQITAGNGYACALTSTGGAYCWGLGTSGQLGQNTAASSTTPVAVSLSAGVALAQISVAHWTNLAGSACAVTNKGAAYCWGANASGQLGDNTTTQRNLPTLVDATCGSPCSALAGKTVIQVSLGDAFACALDAAGLAYCWGAGGSDQLGITPAASSLFPVAVSTAGVLAGGVVLTQIGSGSAATCAGDNTGDFYCWGTGTSGQLGNGTTTSSTVPVIVMPYPPISVAAFPGNTNTTVYWAAATPLGTDTVTNYTVTLSPGDATCTVSTLTCTITGLTNGVTYSVTVVTNTSQGPSAPSTAATVTPWPPGTITAGKTHSCTIFSGKAYCWGDDTYGELGNGVTSTTAQLTPVAVVTTGVLNNKTLTQISAGYNFTCALDSTGVAYCWGYNGNGQLGNNNMGTNTNVPVLVTTAKTFTQISAGNTDVCAVDSGALADCWGDGAFGQLGNGTTTSSPVPIAVTTGAGATIVQVSVGYYDSCAVAAAGAAYCWGYDVDGELGNNTTNALQNSPVQVSGGLTMTQVSVGQKFSCGLASTGLAYCWGLDINGQLGNGSTTASSVPALVSTTGTPMAGKTMVQISVISNHHACAVDSTGAAYCWGLDSKGQLGDGTTTETHVPVAVATTGAWTGTTLVQISTGYQHTCAQDAAGTDYCWGINDRGQLGNNDITSAQKTVPVYVAPQGPTVAAPTPGDATAAISWTAPVFLNNGTITGYTAAASPGGASCSTTTATSCTISGLTDGTLYTITVTVTATTGTASGNTVTVTPVGFLMLTSPSSLTWGVTGNGVSQSVVDTVAADQQFTATDNTGTGLGWHITVSATTFTNGTHALPDAGTFYFTGSTSSLVSATPSVTCVASCTPSTDTTTYPVAITTAPSSPATSTIYDTPAATGLGVMTIGGSTAANPMGWWVQVRGSTYAGTYTTTVSLSIISGP